MSDEEGKKPKPRGFSEVMRDAIRVAESAGTTVRDIAEAVVGSAVELADAVAESGQKVAEAGAQKVRVAAERATSAARDFGSQARRVLALVDGATRDAGSVDALRERFVEVAGLLAPQLDAHADAYVIGTLGEGGLGIQRIQGVEILYLRSGPGPARLRVATLEGRGAKLAAGASSSVYVGCLYGPRALLALPLNRRGADVGVSVASFRFLRANNATSNASAGGWLVELAAGLGVGIPIISDLGAFELNETIAGDHALTPDATDAVERALAAAPDRAWRRGLAQSLISGA